MTDETAREIAERETGRIDDRRERPERRSKGTGAGRRQNPPAKIRRKGTRPTENPPASAGQNDRSIHPNG